MSCKSNYMVGDLIRVEGKSYRIAKDQDNSLRLVNPCNSYLGQNITRMGVEYTVVKNQQGEIIAVKKDKKEE